MSDSPEIHIEPQDIQENTTATELINPAEQLRPVLTNTLLHTSIGRYRGDGYYAFPWVNGNRVEISSYHSSLDRTYLERYPDGGAGPDRHKEMLEGGTASIDVNFKVDPEERNVQGRAVSRYHYGLIVPREIDVWHPDMAAVFGITVDDLLDIEDETRENGSPITTPEELQARLGRDDVDLSKPVVIAATYLQDNRNEGKRYILGERTEANTSDYTRLQALYDELRKPSSDVVSTNPQ